MSCKPCQDKSSVLIPALIDAISPNLPPPVDAIPSSCPTNSVVSIGKVQDYLIITMDDCTYYKVNLNKLDVSSLFKVNSVLTDVSLDNITFKFKLVNQITGEEKELLIPLPKASISKYGVVRFASPEEVQLGNLNDVVIAPDTLKQVITNLQQNINNYIANEIAKSPAVENASYTKLGVVRYANRQEVIAKADNLALTPLMASELFTEMVKTSIQLATGTVAGVVIKKTAILDKSTGDTLGYLTE